jgi:hypothetical protein
MLEVRDKRRKTDLEAATETRSSELRDVNLKP